MNAVTTRFDLVSMTLLKQPLCIMFIMIDAFVNNSCHVKYIWPKIS